RVANSAAGPACIGTPQTIALSPNQAGLDMLPKVDGKRIVYTNYSLLPNDIDIFQYDLETSQALQVTPTDGVKQFSAAVSRNRVVYQSDVPSLQQSELFLSTNPTPGVSYVGNSASTGLSVCPSSILLDVAVPPSSPGPNFAFTAI